ncbi:protein KINESIN LIGHT CHAIN-RELATED 2-like [Iris pallida]|uniref:Protein KINESIN LIGHT CHAIN-RELATED 2-like n=1 Tax=Iris pallida TaxID=29817 RepID=A0AAX6F1N8_IRIPA|nr:protein KINESIN LIGHT CHAIN-RELATED 2-like [Iris pallida]
MPGIIMEENSVNGGFNEVNSSQIKENVDVTESPRGSATPRSPRSEDLHDLPEENCVDTSIDHLYDNVCEMESSGDELSASRHSFGSENESRIDSELRHLVGGEMKAIEIMEEDEELNSPNNMVGEGSNGNKIQSPTKSSASSKKSKRPSRSQLESDASMKSTPKSASKPPIGGGRARKLKNGTEDSPEAGPDNPELGNFYLKHARELISSDSHSRALKYALRAAKAFEKSSNGKPSLELVMALHVIAAIHCSLGRFNEAIPILEQSIEIPSLELGQEHALAKFSGLMQLGDTYSMLGLLESSIHCYTLGLEVQMQALGDNEPRVGETCRYLAEAHVQALQFDEAESLCRMALDIHKDSGETSSLEETADRRLMGFICDTKGDHEVALEHLNLASMAMVANGLESEVSSVDLSIGDIYLSLGRYDEAVLAYQKALAVFKSSKGENHPSVASVFVRLADLYNKTGKLRESKTHCENALKIYGKPMPGTNNEEIASGLTDVSAIYESMGDHDHALKLLKKVLKLYKNSLGQQNTIAGIEAQMGVLYYIMGNYGESYASFKNAIAKLRASGEKKSAFFGIALNQMGLACVQRFAINEAAELFEEARSVLEQAYGPYHPDTLGVYSNLAGTYDAMGRLDEAIEMLEHVVGIREEKLGTANPDVDDEKRRLGELLKEAGRVRSRKGMSLETLLDTNPPIPKKGSNAIAVRFPS